MKLPIVLCCTALLVAAAIPSHAQLNGVEDHPYRPSPSVVKGTLAALSDSSEEVVAGAVRALADWREASAAPEIVKLLAPDTSETIREEALHYFSRLGGRAKPYLADILKFAKDSDPNIRAAVLGVVLDAQGAGENLEAIHSLLEDPRSDVRAAAVRCLGQAGPAAMAYRKPLFDLLAHTGTPEVSAEALLAIGQIGGVTIEEIDTLIPLLRHGDAEVRIAAWSAVWRGITSTKAAGSLNGKKLDEYRASLPHQFDSEPAEVQTAIIEEIGKMKGVAKLSVENLVPRLKSPDAEVRAVTLRVLGKAGEAALNQVPLILEQAKDTDSIVRAGAIAALGSIGPAAVKPNLKLVANALLDSSDLVREEALNALPAAGDGLADFPFKVRTAYASASPQVRATLIKAVPIIMRGRPMNDEVIASSRAALDDANPDVRLGMAFVLGQLGGKSDDPLLPDLLKLTKDSEAGVRGAAALALRAYISDDATKKQFRAELRPLLKDQDAQVRWAALDTLHELDPGQEPELVTEIAGLLKDEDEPVRDAAVRTLGAAGAVAKPYLTDIVRFFIDDPATPPYAAAQAVLEMSPLTPQELATVLYPLYVHAELAPLTRVAAYGASGAQPDGLLILRLLNRGQGAASDLVGKDQQAHATTLLQDALKAPLLQDKLKAEITARLTEVQEIH